MSKHQGRVYVVARVLACVMALAALLVSTPSRAKPFKYEVSPAEKPKFDKPLSPFSAKVEPNTGHYQTSVALKLPPARNGHKPTLALRYVSGSEGFMGGGWTIEVPEIRRNVADGVPTYASATSDRLAFVLPGSSGELVAHPTIANQFAPLRAKPFATFHYDSTTDSWTADTTSGVRWTFGETWQARESDSLGSRVFAWRASKAVDRFGNIIRFEYSHHHGTGARLYLTKVTYDLHDTFAASGAEPKVEFTWTAESQPVRYSYKRGYRTVLDAARLTSIVVSGADEAGTQRSRTYAITNTDLTPVSSRITKIATEGLPDSTFQYTNPIGVFDAVRAIGRVADPTENELDVAELQNLEVSYTYSGTTLLLVKDPSSAYQGLYPLNGQYVVTSTLSDVDGDGRPDHVIAINSAVYRGAQERAYWHRNNGAGFDSALLPLELPWCGATGCPVPAITYGFTEAERTGPHMIIARTLRDMNGDGRADAVYLDSASGAMRVCEGSGDGTFATACPVWTTATHTTCPTARPIWFGLSRFANDIGAPATGFENVGLVDLNGDSLPDYVYPVNACSLDSSGLWAELNTGSSFGPAATLLNPPNASAGTPSHIRQSAQDNSYMQLLSDLRDYNGDGLPDRLIRNEPNVTVIFGAGLAFEPDTDRRITLADVSLQKSHPSPNQPNPEELGTFTDQRSMLIDVTGDGLADFVRYDPDASPRFTYQPNEGHVFGTALPLVSGTVPSDLKGLRRTRNKPNAVIYDGAGVEHTATLSVVSTDLLDLDGDGQVELVMAGSNHWQVFHSTAAAQGPHIALKQVTSAAKQDAVEYERVHGADHPFGLWAVAQLEQRDLGSGEVRKRTFSYLEPVYLAHRREFAGFTAAKTTLFKDPSTPFSQIWREYETHVYGMGDVTKKETLNAAGDTYIRIDDYSYGLRFVQTLPSRAWNRVRGHTIRQFDSPEHTTITYAETLYPTAEDSTAAVIALSDRLGLSRGTERYGYLLSLTQDADPADNRCTLFEYYDPPSAHPNLVLKWKTYDYLGGCGPTAVQQAATGLQYDSQCDTPPGPITRGALCAKHIWRGSGMSSAIVQSSYDAFGRLAWKEDGDGVRVTKTYWDTLHKSPYVRTSADNYAHTRYFAQYDGLSGKAGKVCGPQHDGNPESDKCDFFVYDNHGRLEEVRRSLDDAGGYTPHVVATYAYLDAAMPARVERWEVQDPQFLSVPQLPQRETKAWFNRWGQTLQRVVSGPQYEVSAYRYNGIGQLTTAWLPYKSEKQPLSVPAPGGRAPFHIRAR
jgi:hypothetical protein